MNCDGVTGPPTLCRFVHCYHSVVSEVTFPHFFLPIFALQVQIAALMQLQGAGADPEQLERMQSMLSQKNSEIEALMTKVRQLEADQVGLIFGFIVSC